MDSASDDSLKCALTLEDEFTLTRIRSRAHELDGADRDSFLWQTVFKLVCRERAFKTVMAEVGVICDTNIDLFDQPTKS